MSATAQLNAALAGRYEIEREVGRGGMATVYLARDLRHHRRVALKVLDPELGAVLGAERFLSEIRVTANLQHPNLLPLFDSGEANGLVFYVMPFVEGETLRARIDREKQLPIADAVRIATSIASALDYAHRHGIIHRDLKPENILLQEDQPLIADFGIALAVSKAGGARVTQTGLSLGTPQYMSPEQATGDRGIDSRTDIYSLGALTYEMLSGEPPHVGTTSQAIIARLMTEEPRPLTSSRRAVPEHVDGAVRCALEKLPADRFQTAKEFGDALNGRGVAPTTGRPATSRSGSKRSLNAGSLGVLGAAIVATAAVTWFVASRSRTAPAPIRFEISPVGQTLMDPSGVSVAVSRDGQSVAYLALTGGRTMIHLRRLTEWQSRVIPGTEGAWDPRFSPDGRWILFGVGGQPRKVAIDGGAPINLPAGMNWTGISWGVPETIVLAGQGRLHAFSPNGGTPRVIADPDSVSEAIGVADPFVFPDGSLVAFRVMKTGGSYLATVPLNGGELTIFDFPFANAIGYDKGWLIFGRSDGTIAAVELKDRGRKLGGRVIQLLEGAAYKASGGVVAALSPAGTLVYLEGDRTGRVVFLDGKGATVGSATQLRFFYDPQFSPDGKRVALTIIGTDSEIWVLEIATNTLSLLTRGSRPAWTPDGRRILYLADSTRFLSSIPADLSGPSEQLVDRQFHEVHVSPDGRQVVARGPNRAIPANGNDIFLIPLDGDHTPVAIIATPAHESMPRISPDGRWLAYVSTESGESEVYVRPLKGGARTQISAAGGVQPVWAPDGKRIYYLNNTVLQAVDLQSSPSSLEVVRRDSLFSVNLRGNPTAHQTYDISPDGKRFVGIDAQGSGLKLKVIVNWLTEARAKLQ